MNALLEFFNFSAEISAQNSSIFLGVAIALSVLALIVAIYALSGKSAAKKEYTADAPSVAPADSYTMASDAEIIAVIAAAIAAAESECTGSKFRVVSFKRK